jgi:hypothetical protein
MYDVAQHQARFLVVAVELCKPSKALGYRHCAPLHREDCSSQPRLLSAYTSSRGAKDYGHMPGDTSC